MNKDVWLPKLSLKKLSLVLLATANLISYPTLGWSTPGSPQSHKGALNFKMDPIFKLNRA